MTKIKSKKYFFCQLKCRVKLTRIELKNKKIKTNKIIPVILF